MTISEKYQAWQEARNALGPAQDKDAAHETPCDDAINEALYNLDVKVCELLSATPQTMEDLAMQFRVVLVDPEFIPKEMDEHLEASIAHILEQAGIHAGETKAA